MEAAPEQPRRVRCKVMTWNMWAIPLFSPRPLCNPRRCAKYCRALAKHEGWNHNHTGIEEEHLIILNCQELWAWKTGIFPLPNTILRLVSYLEEYVPILGFVISWLIQLISVLLGYIPVLSWLPFHYEPKLDLIDALHDHLPFHCYFSEMQQCRTFLDSGLLMLFNREPSESGFESFEHYYCDDSLANKGVLWALFSDLKLLAINTHLQASGSGLERDLQMQQLRDLVLRIKQRTNVNRVIIAGDFNIDLSAPQRRRKSMEKDQESTVTNHIHIDHKDEEKQPDLYDDVLPVQPVMLDPQQCSHHLENMTLSGRVLCSEFQSAMGAHSMMIEPLPLSNDEVTVYVDQQPKNEESECIIGQSELQLSNLIECRKLSDRNPTERGGRGMNLDHVFSDIPIEGTVQCSILGRKPHLSDHYLIQTDFTGLFLK